MAIETRCDSEEFYEFARNSSTAMESARKSTGFLSIQRSQLPTPTIELDEDSFFLAFQSWGSFVEFSLGAYAAAHQNARASVYTYYTISTNTSDGELHQRVGRHNACFIGVVGRQKSQVVDTVNGASCRRRPPSPIALGEPLKVTLTGSADQIASTANFVAGESGEGVPAVHVRGLAWSGEPSPARALVREPRPFPVSAGPSGRNPPEDHDARASEPAIHFAFPGAQA